jgi:outer membrane protein OmpA-like peptidoglycan-associated protein
MKKIILKESQVKNIIKNILNEQSLDNEKLMGGQQTSEDTWQLCSYEIMKKGGDYYVTNSKGKLLKLPLASEIAAEIATNKGGLHFSDEIWNGIDMGKEMNQGDGSRKTVDKYGVESVWLDGPCYKVRPMQYAGASTNGYGGSWFIFIDDLTNRYGEPTPVYSIFTWDGSLKGNYPTLEVLKNKKGTIIKFRESRTQKYVLEISPALAGSKNRPPKDTPPPVKQPEFEKIQLDIQSPFEFDKVTLTPEAEIEFKKFVEKVKTNYQGVSGTVEVISSASIDGDENQKRDYNQRLSDNRASTIANRLKNETGITTLNFVPKGIGQTDQFAKGMKYPEVKDTNKTAPNRRLIIKMPELTREKK